MAASYVQVDRLRRKAQLYESLTDQDSRRWEGKLRAARAKLERAQAGLQATGLTLPEDVVLKVQDLCMYFGGIRAVDGLSFQVKKGEIFGLIGPNGAGKTTVFNCITQFYKPTSGTICFENKSGQVVDLNRENIPGFDVREFYVSLVSRLREEGL